MRGRDERVRISTGWVALLSPAAPPPIAAREWVVLGAVMLAALALRVVASDRIPAVVFHDECDNLVNAHQILNGRGPGFFGLDWKPQPAAGVHLLALFLRAGATIAALRLPAALFGVAALVPFYACVRRVVAVPVALLATVLLASDIWYLHFSRTGWENVHTCLFALAALHAVGRAVESGSWRWFVGAGFWAACGAYGYPSGRLILPAVLLTGALAAIPRQAPRRRLAAGSALAAAVAVALFLPQVPAIAADWSAFQSRSRFVYLFGEGRQGGTLREKARVVAEQFDRKAGQIFSRRIEMPMVRERPDRYLRVEGGALSRPSAGLVAAGLVLALTNVAWFASTWRWWVFLLVTFAGTQALTIGSLNGARGVIFVPLLYLFAAVPLDLAWRGAVRLGRPFAAALAALALAAAAHNAAAYFAWVRSPQLLEALQPAIPVDEFPAWQARVREWTAQSDAFYNLDRWRAERAAAR